MVCLFQNNFPRDFRMCQNTYCAKRPQHLAHAQQFYTESKLWRVFFPFLTTFSSPLITREPPTTKWTLLLATHGFLLPFLRVVTLWSNLTSLCMEKIPGAVGKVLNLRAIWGLVQQTLQYLARRSRLTPCEFVIRAKR